MRLGRVRFHWQRLLAALGGLLWMFFHYWLFTSHTERLDEVLKESLVLGLGLVVASNFMGIGLYAYFRSMQHKSISRTSVGISLIGLALVCLGLFLNNVLWWDPGRYVGLFGQVILSFGLAAFGFANLFERALSRLNILPLLMVAVYVPSWLIELEALPVYLPANFTELLAAIYGAGWIALGWLISREMA
jgi:hypothetical protein